MAGAPPVAEQGERGVCEGVLLYYKYIDLASRQEAVRAFYVELCGGLEQKGRIRVAKDGVNVTVSAWLAFASRNGSHVDHLDHRAVSRRCALPTQVGGNMPSLDRHIEAVKAHPLLQGCDIDFKLAASSGPVNDAAQQQTGFTRLAVNLCQVPSPSRSPCLQS